MCHNRKRVTLALSATMAVASIGCVSGRDRPWAADRDVRHLPEITYLRLADGYWQIWVSDANGQHPTQVTHDPTDKQNPRWTADGAAILYSTANQEPFAADLRKEIQERILPNITQVTTIVPAATPSDVLYTRFRAQVRDNSDVWTAKLDGSEPRLLVGDVGLQYDPTMSPDGRWIAYVSGHGFGTHELFVCDSAGGSRRQLTRNRAQEAAPAWSPDSARLAYVSDASGTYQVWLIDIAGGSSTQITDGAGMNASPSWSPDGRQIAFASTRSGEWQIWIMDSDGRNARQVTAGSPCKDPCWRRTLP